MFADKHRLGCYHSRFKVSRNALVRQVFPGGHRLFAAVCLVLFSCLGQTFGAVNPKLKAQVMVVRDSRATDAFEPSDQVARELVDGAITNLFRTNSLKAAWLSVVSTQDVIGLKVYSVPGPRTGTRPAVVAGVIEGLLAAGVPPKNIVVWDRQVANLRAAGFIALARRYGVRAVGADQTEFNEQVFYDSPVIGNLIWGDLEFRKEGPKVGRKSFVSKLVSSELTRIISIAPLLNHNLAGTVGHLMSVSLGSVDNVLRFESDMERLAVAVPEIYALPEVGDKVALCITDALISQYEGTERSLLHYSEARNEIWAGKDPVALDVLAIRELDLRRPIAISPKLKGRMEIYSNAALLELGVNDVKRIEVERKELGK